MRTPFVFTSFILTGIIFLASCSKKHNNDPQPGPPVIAHGYTVTTLAGDTAAGYVNGLGAIAQFNNPGGVAVDFHGNAYIADINNHRIRRVNQTGLVTTRGNNGYPLQFMFPIGVAVDAHENLYVADTYNHRIRKIDAAGVITTFAGTGINGSADGPGVSAQFSYPCGITIDAAGNLYVADTNNNLIRKITPLGDVSTFAGSGVFGSANGPRTTAQFAYPNGIAVDAAGNVYVGDTENHLIRKISAGGNVTTLAGGAGIKGFQDARGTAARFLLPHGLAIDNAGNLYVADTGNHRIREISPDGTVSTFAGGSPGLKDGDPATAQFNFPRGLAVDAAGNIYVADAGNNAIRKINK